MKALVSLSNIPIAAKVAALVIFEIILLAVAPLAGAIVLGLTLAIFAPKVGRGAHALSAALRARAVVVGTMLAIMSLALIVGGAAYAADAAAPATSTVSIPWGDWLAGLLATTASIVAAVLSWVVGRFAPAIVKTVLTNDVIAKGVDYALAAVEGAVRGKTADVAISNEILAAAVTYIRDHYPTIAKWIGANLEPLIIARLSALGVLPAEASAATLGTS